MMAYGHLVFPHISTWQKIIITWTCSKKYGVSLWNILGVAEDQPSQQKKHGFLIGKKTSANYVVSMLVFNGFFANHLLNLTQCRGPSSSHHQFYAIKYDKPYPKWVCLKMGYTPNYSHLVGIMIINHWV